MDKKKRLLILIFVLILSGIVVIFIHKNGSMKGDSIMEENAISGDDNTHWFHSNGIITSIDNSQKKICVDISQKNNFFDIFQAFLAIFSIKHKKKRLKALTFSAIYL